MPTETKAHVETVIRFLEENEQYGDDWQTEIKVLRSLTNKETT